ncbi:MAG: fructosamine kinase family protein [Maribacter sp.]|uniref:fructosamine kinase family protein n=1 Tax=Maribacter sp. TaxID=1897614 RepID=UPI003C759D0D
MLSSSFKTHISQVLDCPIKKIEPVSGGDISTTFCIYTPTERFFCKVNDSAIALDMFHSEKAGLECIQQTNTIRVPQILGCGKYEGRSFLLMEFIESKSPNEKDMDAFGHQLAKMHSCDGGDLFGWDRDNFIGSLPQSNNNHSDWPSFFVFERLLPQLKMANENKLLSLEEIPSENALLKGCLLFFPKVRPDLLHGDLWSGNYLISTLGDPYLIDPSVYFGHAEVDLAMTRLFGGFSSRFYDAYREYIPSEAYENERKDIYQLYYLLVHLNLFGKSYYPSVMRLLKTYFSQR